MIPNAQLSTSHAHLPSQTVIQAAQKAQQEEEDGEDDGQDHPDVRRACMTHVPGLAPEMVPKSVSPKILGPGRGHGVPLGP